MKQLTILLCLLFSTTVNSQTITFPDNNLKNFLLNATVQNGIAYIYDGQNYINTVIDLNNNQEIEVSEAENINYLDLHTYIGSPNSIINPSGIEYFTNLIFLDISSHDIEELDVSALTSLKTLRCYDNELTDLDISNLPSLEWLHIAGNEISILDFSANPNLLSVNCNNNNLSVLDFHSNPLFFDLGCAFNNISHIDIKNGTLQNTGLGVLQCDGWSNNPISSICVDQNEIDSVIDMIDYWGSTANVNVCELSTNESLYSSTIKIYPLPTNGIITIASTTLLTSLKLYDLSGRLVLKWAGNNNNIEINLEFFPSGIYYAQMDDINNITQKIKIIKD